MLTIAIAQQLRGMVRELRLVSHLFTLVIHDPPFTDEETAWIDANDSGWLSEQVDEWEKILNEMDVVCLNCGHSTEPSWSFCPFCGDSLFREAKPLEEE